MLQIYNSWSQKKEAFKPNENQVRMYVCGMTVYDYCHVGHARVMIAFDMVSRFLTALGFNVQYVRNITDIDDKIIKRANELGEPFQALTERFIQAMHEDSDQLNVLPPDAEPRATRYIEDIIQMITQLIEKGHAYEAKNHDVYFSVESFESYGMLSKKKLADLRVGARVAADESKKDPLDFVLWKAAKPDDPSWDSPWGAGRPGWHIECSAMSTKCLGESFDIHGGGGDLLFPHHENEIAQSEAATNKKYVNTWMHVGFVQINDEKMSKSLGNFFTIRDVLTRYNPEVLRYFILSSHYRSPLNYSDDQLNSAHHALERFYSALRSFDAVKPIENSESSYSKTFFLAMQDDFNTPEALAVLFALVKDLNKLIGQDDMKARQLASELKYLASILGLLYQTPEQFLQTRGQADIDVSAIEALILKRETARADKDWALADDVRKQLSDMNIVLEDSQEGTKWRRGNSFETE